MRRRGSLSIEYSVLIAIIISSIIAMMVYVKRSMMGKLRDSADSFGFGRQYEPGVTTIKQECFDKNGGSIPCCKDSSGDPISCK